MSKFGWDNNINLHSPKKSAVAFMIQYSLLENFNFIKPITNSKIKFVIDSGLM